MAFSLLNNSLLLNKSYLIILGKSDIQSPYTYTDKFDRKLSFNKEKNRIGSSPHNYNYGNSCSVQLFIAESVSSSMAYSDNSNRPLYVLKFKMFIDHLTRIKLDGS